MGDRVPWARLLLGLAVVGPALCIGGALPWVLPAFVAVNAALLVRVCWPRTGSSRRPIGLGWFGVAAVITALHWIPIGNGVVTTVAPGIAQEVARALEGLDVPAWARLSVLPGATAMEVSRIAALGLLFFTAAQMSWRRTAKAVVVVATVVGLVGVAHRGMGVTAIYGLYTPVEISAFGEGRVGILTSFVNPNHQSGLLLLGIGATLALLLDTQRHQARGPLRPEVGFALVAALSLQVVVLLLSYSRAALGIAGLVYGPALLVVAIRRPPGTRYMRLILGPVIASVVVGLLVDGSRARAQLETLLDPESFERKFRSVRAGLRLIEHSPWLGTGRGTAIDLIPLVRTDLDPVVYTHIESVPVTLLVEWGPVLGGAMLLSFAGWWVLTMVRAKDMGRRLLALGILAVVLQNGFDFNLEYLGVAAPLVAVAGCIAPVSSRSRSEPGRALVVGITVAVVAGLIAVLSLGAGRTSLRLQHRAVASGQLDPAVAVGRRPLDAAVHVQLARKAADEGAWEEVERRAGVAARLAPSTVDPWLLRGAAATALGRAEDARTADTEALGRLRPPVDPELVGYLVGRYRPDALAEILPDDRERVQALLDALLEPAPLHADAVAEAWVQAHRDDPFTLAYRAEIALARTNPALALHHARLYYAAYPASARAASYVARSLSSFAPPRDAEACAVLEDALAYEALDDPGTLEEQLILCLRRVGTPQALEKVEAILPRLLARPAPRAVVRRRHQLDPRRVRR
ncbi:MAG: O-antigen ligase family protein [Deltaproteobacteria bacterium]|nr:O-antigen ligase family protein [Deltaproteobacteria bacterium]